VQDHSHDGISRRSGGRNRRLRSLRRRDEPERPLAGSCRPGGHALLAFPGCRATRSLITVASSGLMGGRMVGSRTWKCRSATAYEEPLAAQPLVRTCAGRLPPDTQFASLIESRYACRHGCGSASEQAGRPWRALKLGAVIPGQQQLAAWSMAPQRGACVFRSFRACLVLVG
jgi:hypothetical protein